MDNHLWNQKFCERGNTPVPLEVKIVLFLYLMTREADYGWNISAKFKDAIKTGKWTDRRPLSDLKHENKVEAALKQMEKSGLIYKSANLKTKIPPSCLDKKLNVEIIENPRRNYYSINPGVFIHSANTDIPSDYNDGEVSFNSHFLMYSSIYHGVCLVQVYKGQRSDKGYEKNAMDTIELINRLPKFDYLTILTTMIWICRDAIEHYPGVGPVDDSEGIFSFFNNPKRFTKLLSKASSDWEERDMMNFLSKFEQALKNELIREVYLERMFV
jgi:hypothetical protein